MKHHKISDREVYPALWITLAVFTTVYLMWRYVFKEPAVTACVFYKYWHVYCPACGGTRAVLALLHGRILQSLYFHPAVLFAAISAGAYLVSQTIWRIRGRRGWVLRYSDKWLLGLAVVLLFHCLLRNLLWFAFQIPL